MKCARQSCSEMRSGSHQLQIPQRRNCASGRKTLALCLVTNFSWRYEAAHRHRFVTLQKKAFHTIRHRRIAQSCKARALEELQALCRVQQYAVAAR